MKWNDYFYWLFSYIYKLQEICRYKIPISKRYWTETRGNEETAAKNPTKSDTWTAYVVGLNVSGLELDLSLDFS